MTRHSFTLSSFIVLFFPLNWHLVPRSSALENLLSFLFHFVELSRLGTRSVHSFLYYSTSSLKTWLLNHFPLFKGLGKSFNLSFRSLSFAAFSALSILSRILFTSALSFASLTAFRPRHVLWLRVLCQCARLRRGRVLRLLFLVCQLRL